MESTKRTITYVTVAVVLTAVVFGFLAFFERGYRLDGARIVRPATLVLTHVPETAKVHIGGKEVRINNQEGRVMLPLVARTQHVIVSRDGFWPWEKEIQLTSGQLTEFGVFLMPTDPTGTPVADAAEKRALEAAFASKRLPTRAAPLVSHDGNATLFVEDGKIVTTWKGGNPPQYFCVSDPACSEHAALTFEAELRDIAFYPNRNDVALLAIQNGIFVLELDNRGTQNYQPVYRGTRPRLLIKEGVAYLQEGQAVLRLAL